MSDEEVRKNAIEYAKQNKKQIANQLTNPNIYKPDSTPISVFMAGSPGAGKTEFSKNLIAILERDKERRVVRIDGDEIRPRLPSYTGANSYLFQGAISLIVEKIHDLVLHRRQTFVLDSTFAKYEKGIENIKRSLEKKRPVIIFYIYQSPEVAWKFTQARERAEGRNIPKSAFIDEFLAARDTVCKIRKEFGSIVTIFLVKKDFERNAVEDIIEIEPQGMQIDDYIPKIYTKEELEKIL